MKKQNCDQNSSEVKILNTVYAKENFVAQRDKPQVDILAIG